MKIKELKHNHSLTDLLKVILFSIVMLLPFFSVLTRSLYVICNKNAYQSYYGETINEVEMLSVDTLEANKKYLFSSSSTEDLVTDSTINYTINISYINVLSTTNSTVLTYLNENADYINRFFFSNNGTNNAYIAFPVTNGTTQYVNLKDGYISFEFVYINGVELDTFLMDFITEYSYNEYSYLDNAFEYSLNELENNDLFSWTKNTGTYTAINAMCTGLEMEMPVIPVILTYWFLISVIYLVLDIVIKTITYITHIIGSKA